LLGVSHEWLFVKVNLRRLRRVTVKGR
jgi:hypothetical protein